MNDSYLTVRGWVGGDVERKTVGDAPLATLSVGSTPRRMRDGEWVDGETQWFKVTCWRALALNVAASVRKGDAVVVHGRVRMERWTRADGSPGSGWSLEAVSVGHDLSWGTSQFTKVARGAEQPAA